jgi:hypothetical protein
MPAMSIPHTPVAITMLRRVILIADTSWLTLLLENIIYHPVTDVYRDHALHSSTCDERPRSATPRHWPPDCDCVFIAGFVASGLLNCLWFVMVNKEQLNAVAR